MRNIIVATAAGLGLAVSFIGGWGYVDLSRACCHSGRGEFNPLQIMTSARNLPTPEFVDYTFVF